MRANKGLGRSFSRHIRLNKEEEVAAVKAERVSPYHLRHQLRDELLPHPKRVIKARKTVVSNAEVNQFLRDAGIRVATGHYRELVAFFLRNRKWKESRSK